MNSSPRYQSKNLLIKFNSDKNNESNRFPYKTNKAFRLSRPAPYKDSEYFDWFIKEEWTTDHPECTSLITHDGKGYNLKQLRNNQNNSFLLLFVFHDLIFFYILSIFHLFQYL